MLANSLEHWNTGTLEHWNTELIEVPFDKLRARACRSELVEVNLSK